MKRAIVIALACCCLGSSSAWAIDCMSAAGNPKDGWYAWRQIDGRKCWFLKKGAMPAKSQLRWPERAEQESPAKDEASPPSKDKASQRAESTAVAPPLATANGPELKPPPRFKLVRVRATTGALPQLGNVLMMNGSLSTLQALGAPRRPGNHAPADSFNARFTGGTH